MIREKVMRDYPSPITYSREGYYDDEFATTGFSEN